MDKIDHSMTGVNNCNFIQHIYIYIYIYIYIVYLVTVPIFIKFEVLSFRPKVSKR